MLLSSWCSIFISAKEIEEIQLCDFIAYDFIDGYFVHLSRGTLFYIYLDNE